MVVWNPLLRQALLLVIALAAIFNSPALGGLVICLGMDGHLAVEASIDGKCGPDTRDGEASFQVAHGDSHCGNCTDVVLSAACGESRRALSGTVQPDGLALAWNAPARFLHLSRMPEERLAPPPPGGDPHLTHLRTVRLLV